MSNLCSQLLQTSRNQREGHYVGHYGKNAQREKSFVHRPDQSIAKSRGRIKQANEVAKRLGVSRFSIRAGVGAGLFREGERSVGSRQSTFQISHLLVICRKQWIKGQRTAAVNRFTAATGCDLRDGIEAVGSHAANARRRWR